MHTAILSIHAYVEKHRNDAGASSKLKEILDHVDPMSPPEAADIIGKDTSPRGPIYRRRALLRLLSWVPTEPEVRAAVEILAGPEQAGEIYDALRVQLHLSPGACDNSDTQVTVNAVLNKELGEAGPYKKCPVVQEMSATVVEVGGNIGIWSRFVGEGSLDGARGGLDAQNWEHCSTLWSKTYLVKLDANNQVKENAKCAKSDDPDCMPVMGASKLLGESYDTSAPPPARPLFENFKCDQIPCDVRLMLHINAVKAQNSTPVPEPSPAYMLTYGDPVGWKDFPFPSVDQGWVKMNAEDLQSGTNKLLTVESNKIFGFKSWSTTASIYFVLKRIEMASYLADLVCC